MKKYSLNPVAFIISERLKQLIIIYGVNQVEDELLWSQSDNSQLEIHINNLLLTYDTSVVIELGNNLFYGAA